MTTLRNILMTLLIGLLFYLFSLNIVEAKISESKIDSYCQRYKYKDCTLIKSIIWHETGFNEKAYNPERTGSYGLMQIQCSTAKMIGLKYGCEQLFDPQINVRFGILYLKWIKENKVLENIDDLVAAYNAGSPIKCTNKNYNEEGKLLCYPGEYINHNYLYGDRGVMREYKHRRSEYVLSRLRIDFNRDSRYSGLGSP